MRNLLVAIAFLTCIKANAQMEISVGTGVGWYRMSDFKKFQEDIKVAIPVDAQITEEFPPYITYEGSLIWHMYRSGFLGLYYQFGSTAGRIYYEDYSGKTYTDMMFRYNTLTLSAGEEMAFENNFFLRIDLHPGVTFTNLEVLSISRIANQGGRDFIKFHSVNAVLQPTVEIHKMWGNFGIKATVGYHFGVYEGKMKLNENKDAYLTSGNDKITAEWNGLRLGISGRYVFPRATKEK